MDFSTELTSDTFQDSQSAFNPSTTSNFNFGTSQDIISGANFQGSGSSIFTVNSIADVIDDNDGVTTLREAINFANGLIGEDSIVFDSSLFASAQTITLSLGQLSITDSLNINAPVDSLTSAGLLTISGNNASRVFEIGAQATVNFSGLIIADGKLTSDNGAGIYNSGNLNLENTIVRNNTVTFNLGSAYGGGIYSTGILTVSNSTLTGNSVTSTIGEDASGGGIYSTNILTVSNSTVSDNSLGARFNNGTGIYNSGTLTVSNAIISDNIASGRLAFGGGIYNNNNGILTVSNSTITRNEVRGFVGNSGGGIDNRGTLTVSSSSINDNKATMASTSNTGGGIYNTGTVTITYSSINGNSARNGGGIYNNTLQSESTIRISNSTIDSNSAAENGGGIYNSNNATLEVSNSYLSSNLSGILSYAGNGGGIYNGGSMSVSNSTLTLNKATNGGGVFNNTSGTARVRNTTIAGNLLNTGGINPDVAGNFISDGYNLIGDSTGSTGFGAIGDIIGISINPIDPGVNGTQPVQTFS